MTVLIFFPLFHVPFSFSSLFFIPSFPFVPSFLSSIFFPLSFRSTEPQTLVCELCNVRCGSPAELLAHLNTRLHMFSEKQLFIDDPNLDMTREQFSQMGVWAYFHQLCSSFYTQPSTLLVSMYVSSPDPNHLIFINFLNYQQFRFYLAPPYLKPGLSVLDFVWRKIEFSPKLKLCEATIQNQIFLQIYKTKLWNWKPKFKANIYTKQTRCLHKTINS